MLALTHLSTRYGGREIKDEARAVFRNTVVPRDFDVVEIPLPEKGEPELIRGDAPSRPPTARRRLAGGGPVRRGRCYRQPPRGSYQPVQ